MFPSLNFLAGTAIPYSSQQNTIKHHKLLNLWRSNQLTRANGKENDDECDKRDRTVASPFHPVDILERDNCDHKPITLTGVKKK